MTGNGEGGRGKGRPADLPARLQAALGAGYRVEQELGGGGMSRVFLAEEVRLGRRVVVKVLPPEMSAGVSVERFEREIHLAARLQHPHIVPLLTAGSSDDLLYYIMPFIEGESLRAKLAREGELPVPEALRILRDVLDALAYAHGQHVVHRDIKPDNVMISGKHALVTDFGVAKAVAESTGKTALTSMGVALGTPAYMAPEQATADPHTDHRADIYAVGALAYEMLCGRPPFTGMNAQAVLAAHVTEVPDPVSRHRETVPAALNELIMRCLKKKPADRWQRADELLPHLEAILTPTGGITPTGTQPVISSGTQAAIDQAHPVRVAGLFGLAAVGVLAIVYAAVQLIGLPDWVFYGAIGLLAVGLPIMLLTGHHERRRARERSTGRMTVTPPGGIQRLFTWRRALLGGMVAFAALGVTAAGYTAMRLLGIGPVGTLVAKGAIGERDPLVVADFENRTTDSTLGSSITEALRIDLGQSPVVRLLDGAAIAEVLRRMGRAPSAALDPALAREIAEREGAKAFVAGEVAPLGAGFVLSARVMSTTTGEVLLPVRETAADEAAIIAAVDRLSGKLRERLGESLKSIRAGEPLEDVTTGSLEALRRYTLAVQAFDRADYARAIPLLEEAIGLDSAFAMAHRRLAVAFSNTQAGRSRVMTAARKAFQFRERLPPKERYLADAYYYTSVEPDREKQAVAYRSVLEIDPNERSALNNLALWYAGARRYAEAEELLRRAMAQGGASVNYSNAIGLQIAQGKFAAAETTLARYAERMPTNPTVWVMRGGLAAARGDSVGAAAALDSFERRDPSPQGRVFVHNARADRAVVHGKLADAERQRREAMAAAETMARGAPGAYFGAALSLARIGLELREKPQEALKEVEAALRRYPLSAMAAPDRPYLPVADFYADAGRVDLARRMMAEYEREVDEVLRQQDPGRHNVAGSIALAEGSLEQAVAAFRRFREEPGGPLTGLVPLAQAYDRLGNADSALAYYEQFVTTPTLGVGGPLARGPAYKRLGELYEQRSDRAKAIDYYNKFAELWKDADPELQPVVNDVKQRMARLVAERPR